MKGFLESLQKRLSEIDKELNPSAATDPDGKQPLYSGGSQGMKDPYGGFQFSLMTPTGGGSARRRAEADALGVDAEAISQAAPKQPTPEEERQATLGAVFQPGDETAITKGPRPPEIFFPGVDAAFEKARGIKVDEYKLSDYMPDYDETELQVDRDPVLAPLNLLFQGLSNLVLGGIDLGAEVFVKQPSRVGGLFDNPQNFEIRPGVRRFGNTRRFFNTFVAPDISSAETPNIFVRDARFKEQTAKQLGEWAQAYKDLQAIQPQLSPQQKQDVGNKLLELLNDFVRQADSKNVNPIVKTNFNSAYREIRNQIIDEYGLENPPDPYEILYNPREKLEDRIDKIKIKDNQ